MFQKTSLTFNPKPSSLQNHRNANKSLTKLLIDETTGRIAVRSGK